MRMIEALFAWVPTLFTRLRGRGWIFAVSMALAGPAWASGGGSGSACEAPEAWKKWHADSGIAGTASLQRGARNFMNYCVGCHSLKYIRYSRIGRDLGIPEEIVTRNLTFGNSVHDYVTSPMPAADAEQWLGRAPPDLSLITNSKGADYVYRFLKTFYLDDSKSTGVNNFALPDTAMPFVLSALQGSQKAVFVLEKCAEGGTEKMVRRFDRFEQAVPGRMAPAEYDAFVRDTVAFLDYVAEPVRAKRQALGIWAILFLAVFTLFAWMLKREIWKDVR